MKVLIKIVNLYLGKIVSKSSEVSSVCVCGGGGGERERERDYLNRD